MRVTSSNLSQIPYMKHGWFTREGGVSKGIYASLNTGLGSDDDRANVLENRARIAAELGVAADHLVTCYQVHSPDVVTVTKPWAPEDNPQADALVTKVPGIAIGVSSADCGPVLFADPVRKIIGAAHAGWKGAFTGVLEATVNAMVALGSKPHYIRATIGPMISRRAYEVGPEFVARFRAHGDYNARWFSPSDKPGHEMFDLPAYAMYRLARAGVQHIENLDLCTYSDESRFFSYRRMTHRGEADYGRHLSAIVISG